MNLILVFRYLWYVIYSNIVYDTKKSLENDIGARKLDNDKSALHFTSFQIEAQCTIIQPVHFYFSQQFQLPKHRFILRQNAPLSDLVLKQSQQFQLPKHRFKLRQTASLSDLGLKGFSAVPTSENIESIPLVCNI